jgi:hypothetical protein
VTNWGYFACCINERFGPLTRRNSQCELASLRETGTINEYTERFLAHVAHVDLSMNNSRSTSAPPT